MSKALFQAPDACSVSACSAILLYEKELAKHAATEAKLRKVIIRENALIQQKNEIIKQRDTLAQEAEHRLLNGLQLLTSLLSLQGRTAKNPETAAQLQIAANRVATLGRVHRHLHALDGSKEVEFKGYLERLCQDLSDIAPNGDPGPVFAVEGICLTISTRAAIPLAFIASELIMNSMKYAQAKTMVGLQETVGGDFVLSVEDDGPGLPEGFDPNASKGLGMSLIGALTKQIGGKLQVGKSSRTHGAGFNIVFPSQQGDQ